MEVTVDNDYGKREVRIGFQVAEHESRPKVDGVVRIPFVKGYTFIRYVDEQQVDVEQVASMDPGGSLPLWLVKLVAEDQPVNTIRALKKQMVKTRGDYADFIRKHEEARLKAVSSSKH
jgi:REP element-mobilizing transposase RayT